MSFYSLLVRKAFDSVDGGFIKSLQSLGFRGSTASNGNYSGYLSVEVGASIWSVALSYRRESDSVIVSLIRDTLSSSASLTLGFWRNSANEEAITALATVSTALSEFTHPYDVLAFYDTLSSAFSSWSTVQPLLYRPLLRFEARQGCEVLRIESISSDGTAQGEHGVIESKVSGTGNVDVSFEGKAPVVCTYNDLYVRFDGDKS